MEVKIRILRFILYLHKN